MHDQAAITIPREVSIGHHANMQNNGTYEIDREAVDWNFVIKVDVNEVSKFNPSNRDSIICDIPWSQIDIMIW